MSIQESIENKLEAALSPSFLRVDNESHMHGGPATESHFKITLASEQFSGVNAVKRHQQVYRVLSEELQGGVHALALHLYTPGEWQETGKQAPASPDCRGGSQAEKRGAG